MAYNEKTAERVRTMLTVQSDVVEKKMMGGLVFMVRGHMCCGVTGDSLMVRVGPDARAEALKKPHVGPLDVGGGRQPRAYICVEPAGFASTRALSNWVQTGLAFVASLPAKNGRSKPKTRGGGAAKRH